MSQTTITVQQATLDRFKELKEELNESQPETPDHTNDLFLQALMDTWEAADDGYYSDPSADEIAEAIIGELDDDRMAGWEAMLTGADAADDRLGSEDIDEWKEHSSTDAELSEIRDEIRKTQELAEQARDAAQQVKEGMGR